MRRKLVKTLMYRDVQGFYDINLGMLWLFKFQTKYKAKTLKNVCLRVQGYDGLCDSRDRGGHVPLCPLWHSCKWGTVKFSRLDIYGFIDIFGLLVSISKKLQ